MSQKPETPNPFDPFGTWRGMRDANLEAWSKTMIDVVNSDAYAQAMGTMLDAYLSASAPFRKLIESTTTQVLTQLNMPTRADINSIAARLNNIELRLDDLDAKLDAVQHSARAQATE